MSCKSNIMGEEGLRFLAEMSISISHEIKNALALIGQNAGLLEDFTLMAEKGMPIDQEKLKILVGRVMKQIRRAEGVVKNMNRFAHSVEESVKSIDLGETLEFVASLCGRSAHMRGVTLKTRPPPSPVTITTTPFFLENLVWLCLNFAMDMAIDGKSVGLIAEETENGARIRFTQLEGLVEAPMDKFPAEREKALLNALKAELATDVASGELVLTLPGDIGR